MTYLFPIVKDPQQAAESLQEGLVVDYQPGDGTRYEVVIARDKMCRWLILRNFHDAALRLDKQWDAIDFALSRVIPAGTWYALRPLLCALGAAGGGTTLHDYDRTREADLRKHRAYDGQPFDLKDLALGREVRRVVEAQNHWTLQEKPEDES